jgi:hypothetical protein
MGLAELGFAVGELVTYSNNGESTGGIIFQIVKNCDAIKPASHRKRGSYGQDAIDEKGRVIKPMELSGYLRLKPIYAFFPTSLGASPKGAGETVLVYHNQPNLTMYLKKVDLLLLAKKYAELGNICRDIARIQGMEST